MIELNEQVLAAFEDELEKIAKAEEQALTSRKDVLELIQPGDVYVTTMAKPHKSDTIRDAVEDKIFRTVSKNLQGDYTHAGMYVGGGKVVEMQDQLHEYDLDKALSSRSAKFLRPKIPKKDRMVGVKRLKDIAKRKSEIDYTGIPMMLKLVAEDVVPKRLFGDEGEGDIEKDRFTCSNLIAHGYQGKLDLSDGKKGRGYIIPKDILATKSLKLVATYKNPKAAKP